MSIRILLPFFWRPFPTRTAAGLQRFATTENDSVWQIFQAIQAVEDPRSRAKVFQHALEEAHHASEFTRVAGSICAQPPAKPLPKRIPIFEMERGREGLVDFMAYAHVSEQDVFEQFSSYAAGIGLPEARDVFVQAKKDERGHAGLTLQFLRRLYETEGSVRMKIFRVRWRRTYEAWLRFSKTIGEGPMAVFMSVIYIVAGLFIAPVCRKSLRQAVGTLCVGAAPSPLAEEK